MRWTMALLVVACLGMTAGASAGPSINAQSSTDGYVESKSPLNDPQFLAFLKLYLAKNGQLTQEDFRSVVSPPALNGFDASSNQPPAHGAQSIEGQVIEALEKEVEKKVESELESGWAQINAGARQAAKKFVDENLLSGSKFEWRTGSFGHSVDDVRTLNNAVFQKKYLAATVKKSQLSVAVFNDVSKANRLRSEAEALQKLAQAGDSVAASKVDDAVDLAMKAQTKANEAVKAMQNFKMPELPKILTQWEKFLQTEKGKKIAAPLEKITARWEKFQKSDLGKRFIRNPPPKVAPPPQNTKLWDKMVNKINKIGAPMMKVTQHMGPNGRMLENLEMMPAKRFSKFYNWRVHAQDTAKRVANSARVSFWQGYSADKGAKLVAGGNKAAFKVGQVAWAKGLSQPVVQGYQAVAKAVGVAKASAKALLGAAGPVAMIASGAHAVTEAFRDISMLNDQAKRGEELDPKLIRNVLFAFTGADVVLGRGGTEMIGGLAIDGAKGLVKHLVGCLNVTNVAACRDRTVAGIKKAVEGTKKAAKWVGKQFGRAHNATKTCMKEKGVHGCTWHATKAVGRGLKKVGKAVWNWAGDHWDHWRNRSKESDAKEEACAASDETQAECDRQEAEEKSNKRMVIGAFAKSVHKSIKAAPTKVWNAVSSWFKGGDDDGDKKEEGEE